MKIRDIYLDTVGSTHTYAKEHLLDFEAEELTCITAEEQTKGQGQFQRKWISPRFVNLYVTFYFQIPATAPYLKELASLMIKSVQKVLQREGLDPKMKWPNDLLLNGKKIAGALCDTEFHESYIEIILSFGLNVNMEEKDLSQVDQPVTSLKEETKRIWDKKALLKEIQSQFILDLREIQS
jgi:BirA family biotin operon repressor/biotin-[acetyl-CoA-carboxylase] ligase